MTTIMMITVIGGSPEVLKYSAKSFGSSVKPRNALKILAPRIIRKISPVVDAVPRQTSLIPCQRIPPRVTARINVPTQPIPAPSVGVNIPV